ncbi:MAG: hypothetical protein IAE77_08870 [Prosthecobacter sp.]|uniref:hypothetical protein n=1 Tax=Prosthecobacter sp. TaxID=1965333 RepID=UPI0019F01836|nr:hypothetical protein [Prosthecobacter sp.]MBE2283562.1 hypothetical protein [Prosthecobacter sp.]
MRNLRWLLFLLAVLLTVLLCGRKPNTQVIPTLADRVRTSTTHIHAAPHAPETKQSLIELKSALRQMDTKEAVKWIQAQLRSGEDTSFQLDLVLDAGQNLSGWPSWRVFLLDLLYLTDPETAAFSSKELLATSRSPDEWAVAMRNLARVGTEDELLKSKSAELLRHKEWQKTPSAGYLEAFDVIVHTRNTELTPDLLAHCDERDAKAVRHASFLTLDRLVMADPAKVLPDLARSASSHPKSGLMLSNMIARADVADPVQRQAVETYLLDPKRTDDELRGFASVFPNANVAVSHNLLTKTPTLQGAELAVRDRNSLETVSRWLSDERFKTVHGSLRTIVVRLQSMRPGYGR